MLNRLGGVSVTMKLTYGAVLNENSTLESRCLALIHTHCPIQLPAISVIHS